MSIGVAVNKDLRNIKIVKPSLYFHFQYVLRKTKSCFIITPWTCTTRQFCEKSVFYIFLCPGLRPFELLTFWPIDLWSYRPFDWPWNLLTFWVTFWPIYLLTDLGTFWPLELGPFYPMRFDLFDHRHYKWTTLLGFISKYA